MDTEPVFISDLNVDELASVLEKVIGIGHKILPNPTAEEWKNRKDPVLAATKAKNWKALATNGASYAIHQINEEIRIDMSYTDEKGRWQNDPRKMHSFPKHTSLQEIIKLILSDAQSRPEVN